MDPDQVIDLLARSQLFSVLDELALRQVARRWAQRVFARGATIFVQEELGDRMFVLAAGVVKLILRSPQGNTIELVRHRPPAVFGEVAVLDGGPRTASAEAVEQSTLIVVPRDEFIRLLRSDGQVAEAMLHSLGSMVRRTTHQIGDLAFLNIQTRVARQLLAMVGEASTTVPPITQRELATMVGGTRQTVNLALRRLEQDGDISLAGKNIEILDQRSLRRRTLE